MYILTGQKGATDGIPNDKTTNDLTFIKYSPTATPIDVERSFTICKNLMAGNSRWF